MSEKRRKSREPELSSRLTAGGIWKGENESDPELVESYDTNPLALAGAWTEDEAYSIYREKLVRLRDLYIGQLSHLKHSLKERRRQFLLEWQAEGGTRGEASHPSQGSSLEDAAYRCYRKRSGEEALLERRQKQRRVIHSLDLFSRKDTRDSNKSHYLLLARLHQEVGSNVQPPCGTNGCDNQCMPYATRCSRHICDDPKQHLYTKCSYVYPSGTQCTNPVPQYLNPLLCGGHCDNVNPPLDESGDSEGTSSGAVETSGITDVSEGKPGLVETSGITDVSEGKPGLVETSGMTDITEGKPGLVETSGMTDITEGKPGLVETSGMTDITEGKPGLVETSGMTDITEGKPGLVETSGMTDITEGKPGLVETSGMTDITEGKPGLVETSSATDVSKPSGSLGTSDRNETAHDTSGGPVQESGSDTRDYLLETVEDMSFGETDREGLPQLQDGELLKD